VNAEVAAAAVAAVAALIGGGAAAALVTTYFQRKQEIRQVLLPPAERFTTQLITIFARLRTVKPPSSKPDGRPHRNEHLLSDADELAERVRACEEALDAGRTAIGGVRLVFQPHRRVVENAGRVLFAQRLMLEVSQQFYRDCEGQEPEEIDRLRKRARHAYRRLRTESAWPALEQFVAEVLISARRPKWGKPPPLSPAKEPSEVLKEADEAALAGF
jgi:hypothetical protein